MHCSGWMEEARVTAASSAARTTLTTDVNNVMIKEVYFYGFVQAGQELLHGMHWSGKSVVIQ